jgi:hypothetical protein
MISCKADSIIIYLVKYINAVKITNDKKSTQLRRIERKMYKVCSLIEQEIKPTTLWYYYNLWNGDKK